ncbi:Flagellum-specific ATP synthase FliI [hydrothermal vent metagenome]|uniref:Flagellum-specific ATP synthase FliI n=1 Tax=hydrothermal vent metagenome TaxID=652676 RepID=A0A3B1CG96_9ZZZZ
MVKVDFAKYGEALKHSKPIKVSGKVSRIVGLVIEGIGPDLPIGGTCDIFPTGSSNPVGAEVVGFIGNRILMMPLGDSRGISPGCHIAARRRELAEIKVDDSILGRVIDGLGAPIDDKGPLLCKTLKPIYSDPINPLNRKRISEPLDLGIRAVNGLLTIGKGQRIGILSGTGVGKSVLLGMMAKNTSADINVIGLIGERGREVKEFIEQNLGEEGMKRSVVVVATSDNPPLIRMRAAFVTTAIAEYFRDQGKSVLLMMDSLTRFAMAQREIGLSVGEPPATKGYTPSVFAALPKLLERAGMGDGDGSITGLYTVLIEGDDISEPISDASRAILDGHLFLSRRLASLGHFPAIDLLGSISRVMVDVASPEHMDMATRFKEVYATYREAEDLINIGAYVGGSNPRIDNAIAKIDAMNQYLRQGMKESEPLENSIKRLKALLN